MNIKEADTAITLKEAITHAQLISEGECGCDCLYQHDCIVDWLTELQQYRKAKAEGRLEILPCQVGDIVYLNADDYPIPQSCRVIGIHLTSKKRYVRLYPIMQPNNWLCNQSDYYTVSLSAFGKRCFLTLEEAKAARSAKAQPAKKSTK